TRVEVLEMNGSKIAANILSGIGIFFFLMAAMSNYSGPVGFPLLIVGFIFFMGGMCLFITGKKQESPK
ncbi:MAG: hypothetical protein LUQ65_10165, partial [Candidatus Helarchaeota archaeon]|nr:hypothetical protein [Candidatus Helarchaeota archaeon]